MDPEYPFIGLLGDFLARGRQAVRRAPAAFDALGRHTLGRMVTGLLQDPNLDPEGATRAERGLLGFGADMTTGLGDIKAIGHDMPRSAQEGHYGQAALAGLSALPAIGLLGATGRRLLSKVDDLPAEGGGLLRSEGGRLPGIEIVDDAALKADDAGDYLYHVTSEPNAMGIVDEGFIQGSPVAGRGGGYEANSAGHTFFTDAKGVGEWKWRIENHLFDQFDDPPPVVVVRVPKKGLPPSLELDPIQDVVGAHNYRVPTEDIEGDFFDFLYSR